MARAVMDQLLRFGEVRRGRIGVVIQDLAPDAAAAMGLGADPGALIARVEPAFARRARGLREGDVVLAVDGVAVHGSTASCATGSRLVEAERSVALDILRDGRRVQLAVKVAVTPMPGTRRASRYRRLQGASLDADSARTIRRTARSTACW